MGYNRTLCSVSPLKKSIALRAKELYEHSAFPSSLLSLLLPLPLLFHFSSRHEILRNMFNNNLARGFSTDRELAICFPLSLFLAPSARASRAGSNIFGASARERARPPWPQPVRFRKGRRRTAPGGHILRLCRKSSPPHATRSTAQRFREDSATERRRRRTSNRGRTGSVLFLKIYRCRAHQLTRSRSLWRVAHPRHRRA